jgi:uncharacterized membrane protein YphA (DoxX/SURF4 family)
MRMLALSPMNWLAGLAPLIVWVIVGVIMAAHGWQKLAGGPANFGGLLAQLGSSSTSPAGISSDTVVPSVTARVLV